MNNITPEMKTHQKESTAEYRMQKSKQESWKMNGGNNYRRQNEDTERAEDIRGLWDSINVSPFTYRVLGALNVSLFRITGVLRIKQEAKQKTGF